jgi:hypothetical protein
MSLAVSERTSRAVQDSSRQKIRYTSRNATTVDHAERDPAAVTPGQRPWPSIGHPQQAMVDHGVPPVTADAIMALRATALEEFASAVHPTVEKITGSPATSVRDWVLRNQDGFR